jgi:hypothetical protein
MVWKQTKADAEIKELRGTASETSAEVEESSNDRNADRLTLRSLFP